MSAATTAPSRPASAPAKSPTASSAPSDLQLSARRLREYQEYSAAHIQDTVQDMMTSLFTESPLPDDPLSFMLDFLTATKGSSEGDGGKSGSVGKGGASGRGCGAVELTSLKTTTIVAAWTTTAVAPWAEAAVVDVDVVQPS
jgi:hypothetical protein